MLLQISPPGVRFSLFFPPFSFPPFFWPRLSLRFRSLPARPYYAGIFLSFVLLHPCSSFQSFLRKYCLLLLIAAVLISLRHLFPVSFQNSFLFYKLLDLIFLSCLCCCVLVPGTLAFHLLDQLICRYIYFRSPSVSSRELGPNTSTLRYG